MAENKEAKESKKSTDTKNSIKEFIDSVVVAFVIAILILTFLVGNYMIPSGSMLETLQEGDRILVNKLSYVLSEPKHGDVVVFAYPLMPSTTYIKRVIGTPGDTIQIVDRQVIRNGVALEEPYVARHRFRDYMGRADNVAEFTVPEGMYLMMGDNRDNSDDGRFWGYVAEKDIKGKAKIVYFSKEPGGGIRWSRFFTLIK